MPKRFGRRNVSFSLRKSRKNKSTGKHEKDKIIKKIVALILVLLIALTFLLVSFVDKNVRPMINIYGENQAVSTGTKAIHQAVGKIIENFQIGYDSLTDIKRDSEGKILSIGSNTHNMNLLKNSVAQEVLSSLDQNNIQDVKIPIGSLAGGILTGRGPSVTIRVPMNSTVETVYDNKFESAGINQTYHRITMTVTVTTYIVTKGEKNAVTVTSDFTVAENIIVGTVPGLAWGVS